MSIVGSTVVALIMLCAVMGAISSIRDPSTGLGKEFLEGIYSIGHIFIPVAGIMATIPLLSKFIDTAVGPAFEYMGADPAIAATSIIAVDMGGYQLADALAHSREGWIMAMLVGYMAGASIVFSIPVGLALLDRKDHKYFALGILSGILSIPVGVFLSSILIWLTEPYIRQMPQTEGLPTVQLHLELGQIVMNLMPLVAFVSLIALGLHLVPSTMIRGFMAFGRVLDAVIKLVLVACIVEYFTHVFSATTGWALDPIIADDEDRFRALEVAGYIGIMLAGAFPMVYLIRKHLASPVQRLGELMGLDALGSAGILASMANILAMFRLVGEMRPRDKVANIAFAVCGAFLFGDHLSFTANFQPNLIPAVVLGKLGGGVFAVFLAYRISQQKILDLERQDQLDTQSSPTV